MFMWKEEELNIETTILANRARDAANVFILDPEAALEYEAKYKASIEARYQREAAARQEIADLKAAGKMTLTKNLPQKIVGTLIFFGIIYFGFTAADTSSCALFAPIKPGC